MTEIIISDFDNLYFANILNALITAGYFKAGHSKDNAYEVCRIIGNPALEMILGSVKRGSCIVPHYWNLYEGIHFDVTALVTDEPIWSYRMKERFGIAQVHYAADLDVQIIKNQ